MLRILRNNIKLRYYSIKHETKKPIKYTNTINLPKTKFPSRLTGAKRKELERQLVDGPFAVAYSYQQTHNKEPTFVLHDGPPYANGDLHMGHAINKILKDITLRQHVVKGQKVHYIPGWDCHGLPIELKATTTTDDIAGQQNALSIRQKCRTFALEAMKRQREEFRTWGVFSDWDKANSIYLTLHPELIKKELQMFQELYEKGLVFRALKPVHWSPSSRTALAEAELEYDTNFVSPSVYVRFILNKPPAIDRTIPEPKVFALVWTTTPWTLPSNQAICYNSAYEYSLVELQQQTGDSANELYLIATDLLSDFEQTTNIKYNIVKQIKGHDLAGCTYKHPIYDTAQPLPFFHASHVHLSKGTGLVHTAPAHGADDFLVSLEHKLAVTSFVNDEGLYTEEAPEFLRGKDVLRHGDQLVLKHIAEDVVSAGTLTHSYPIDWRTKKPVILRASEQWFMNTKDLKDRAVEEINQVAIYPRANALASKNALKTQVLKRPYWCISRQRSWGVPIPVFYERSSGKVITDKGIIAHICKLIDKEGNIDFWWSMPIEELLPVHLLQELNVRADELVKSNDIFDIWYDSGCTWSTVLPGDRVADLYLEGYDQFTGWFQSSLLASIAARDCSPYKSLFVHGFAVDDKGRKMSKSLGNVIAPKDITGKYGVDVLRWWVASHGTQHAAITVSDKHLAQDAEYLVKLRASLRYLNGAIGTKTTDAFVPDIHKQSYLNRYLLSSLVDLEARVKESYDCYEYNHVVIDIKNFVANQISGIYVHLIKDRLYCGSQSDIENVRFTLAKCYEVLCKALWPITPFLVEESWSYYDPGSEGFHHQHIKADLAWKDEAVERVVNAALNVKRSINQKVNDTNSWGLAINIACSNEEILLSLQKLQSELNVSVSDSELSEILQVGNVTLLRSDHMQTSGNDVTVVVNSIEAALCPRCRRYAVQQADCVCERCRRVINS